uniref:Bm1276 n=1 Tax=Brugia malayi TaxID=6279 RepID=A0A1I9G1R3_BRUMA|nr:Bm1276 [Brugia malayi]
MTKAYYPYGGICAELAKRSKHHKRDTRSSSYRVCNEQHGFKNLTDGVSMQLVKMRSYYY